MQMDNLDYTLMLIDLILATKTNNLELTKTLVEQLNQYIPISEEETLITISDIYQMKINNESFNYFLDNYIPTDIHIEQAIWEIKSHFISVNFVNKLISEEEFRNFIIKNLENASPAIRKYRYNGLVRMALMIYDYDTIIRIKEMILSEEEMN